MYKKVGAVNPLAIELYRAFENGKSVLDIARETGIPVVRVEQRLRAAAAFLARKKSAEVA